LLSRAVILAEIGVDVGAVLVGADEAAVGRAQVIDDNGMRAVERIAG